MATASSEGADLDTLRTAVMADDALSGALATGVYQSVVDQLSASDPVAAPVFVVGRMVTPPAIRARITPAIFAELTEGDREYLAFALGGEVVDLDALLDAFSHQPTFVASVRRLGERPATRGDALGVGPVVLADVFAAFPPPLNSNDLEPE